MTNEDRSGYRCVPYAGKHPSWSQDRPQRKKQKESAKLAYCARPTHFQDCHDHPSFHSNHQAAPTLVTATALALALATAPDPAPQLQTGRGRRQDKRKKGRRPGSTKAAKNTADIRSFTHRWLISGNTILGITGCEGLQKKRNRQTGFSSRSVGFP